MAGWLAAVGLGGTAGKMVFTKSRRGAKKKKMVFFEGLNVASFLPLSLWLLFMCGVRWQLLYLMFVVGKSRDRI